MPLNTPTWNDIAEEKPPTWNDVAEEKTPTWDDVDHSIAPRVSSAKALAARPKIAAEIESKSVSSPKWLGSLLGVVAGSLTPAFEHPGRTIFNAPNDLINAVAGRPVVARFNGLDLSGLSKAALEPVEGAIGIPGALTSENSPATGVGRSIDALASGFTDPDVALTLPAYSSGIPEALAVPAMAGRAIMAGQAASHLPEASTAVSRAFSDSNTTTAQKAEAAANQAASVAILAGMSHQIPGRGIEVPPDILNPPASPYSPEIEQAAIAGGQKQRRLGIQVPQGDFAQPGVAELADKALAQRMGANILAPGEEPALLQLRRAINPPQIIENPINLAERIQGGGEAPYGKVSYQRTEQIKRIDQEIGDLKKAKALDPELRTDVKQQRIQEKIDAKIRDLFKLKEQDALIENAVQEQPQQAIQGERNQNALVPETAQPVRPLRDEPIQSNQEVPGTQPGNEVNGGRGKEVPAPEEKTSITENNVSDIAAKEGVKLSHGDGIAYGETLTSKDVPRLQEKYDAANKQTVEAAGKNDNAAMQKAYNESIFYGGALMGATRGEHPASGVNYDLYLQKKSEVVNGNGFRADRSLSPKIDQYTVIKDGKQEGMFSVPKGTPMDAVREKYKQKVSEFEGNPEVAEPTVEHTPLEPATGNPISSHTAWFEKADARLAQVQERIRRGFYSGETAMGILPAILDTALESARLVLRLGGTVSEAIDAAIAHIRKNVKEFDESKVREMFDRELANPPKSASENAGSVERLPKVQGATPKLNDIYKIFEPSKKTGPTLRERASNIAEAFRTGIASKFRPLNKLAEDIGKAYGKTTSKDIAGIFEQLKGSQGKAEADIYRFNRDVADLVKGNEKDFNAYVFIRRSLDRLQNDAKDIANAMAGGDVKALNRRNVANHTIESLTQNLDELKAKLGPEKIAKFEKAADAYQQHLDNALRLQVESGRMSPKVYDAIKQGNQFYAPFKVMKYLEDTMAPPGTGRRVDTTADYTKAMKGIEDPNFKLGDMLAAGRQSIALSRILADKNKAMGALRELAAFDSDHQFIRKLGPEEDAPKGSDAVNIFEDGKQERYAVNKDVAQALQTYGGAGANVILRALSYGKKPFTAGATALNIPFQVSNLMADIPRQALISKYGIRGFNDLWQYPADLVKAMYSSMAGDLFGKDNKLFLDFLDSGVAGTTVQEALTPEALKFHETTGISKTRQFARSVLNIIPEFAAAIEQTSKILGVERAMRFEGVKSGKELADKIPDAITELRRYSGSPDFGRQGKAIEQAQLNLLYMFLNARIQGTLADVSRLAGKDGAKTAASTWSKLAIAIGLPTAYLYYLNQQKDFKDDYDKVPLREKQNYWHIPKNSYITTDKGEKLRDYWRIPKRESSKWIANLTESALDFAQKRDPKAALDFGNSMIQEITPVNVQGETAQEKLESLASGLHPFIKAPIELATGRDLYRHMPIIPDQQKNASPENQFKPSTAEAYKKLAALMPKVAPEFLRSPLILENLTKNLTAGLISQFIPRKAVEGRSTTENFPLLSRFQAAPYTDNSQFQEEMKALDRQAADEQLARHREAVKLIDDNKGKDLRTIIQGAPKDEKLIRQVADLWIAQQNGITSSEKQLLSLPTKQRASYIANQLHGKTPQEQQKIIQDLARKRILTEAVYADLPEAMK